MIDEEILQNVPKIAKGLANAALSLKGNGVIQMPMFDIGNRDELAEAIEAALMELIVVLAQE